MEVATRSRNLSHKENCIGLLNTSEPENLPLKYAHYRSSEDEYIQDWSSLPEHIVLHIFKYLSLVDRARASLVCRKWNETFHLPDLWENIEFEFNQPNTSYLKSTPSGLIKQILGQHAHHLKYVSFGVDSSTESAEAVCNILSQLVSCSLKTLGLISSAKPSFKLMDQANFVSALTVVFINSQSLSSLAIDDTPVDDPSLELLASNHSQTLQLLKMKSCPYVSPAGILAVADHCHGLRELALNYSCLSDELLLALSSEEHVRLEHLRIDICSEGSFGGGTVHRISKHCWDALAQHSPKLNLVMYFFMLNDYEFDAFFDFETPVTHLYFGRYVSKIALRRVGTLCPKLTELVVCANGNSLLDSEIILIAQNCKNLTSLGLGECEISCSAFVEFARICGPRLTELFIMEDVLADDDQYDIISASDKVSKYIGRYWAPDEMPVW